MWGRCVGGPNRDRAVQLHILATDGVEQVELTTPRDALKAEGATVTIVSPKSGTIQGMNHDQKAD